MGLGNKLILFGMINSRQSPVSRVLVRTMFNQHGSFLLQSSHLRERLGVVRQRKLPLSLQGVFFKGYNL